MLGFLLDPPTAFNPHTHNPLRLRRAIFFFFCFHPTATVDVGVNRKLKTRPTLYTELMDRRRRRRVSRASKTIYIKQLKTYFPIHFSNVSDRANTKTTANKTGRDGVGGKHFIIYFS